MSARSAQRARRFGGGVLGGLVVALVGGLISPQVQGETQAAKRRGAEELVREALGHEMYAMDQQRQNLLGQALLLAPDQPAAHWHNGEIRLGNQWLPATGRIETENQQRLREAYEQQRAAAADTVDGQLALANWCVKHHLAEQESAHLNRVLQLVPDHPVARQRLQFERVGNNWVRRQDLWQGLRQTQQMAAATAKWQKKLDELCANLRRTAPSQAAAALERLKSELTPDAVPALEIRLGNQSEPAAQLGVQLLGTLPSHEAAAALARLAVLSPWPVVRDQAAEQLQTRPRDHYVPLLLAELSTPIESQAQTALVNGRIVYRHEFVRETQERREATVLDTVMDRRASLVRTPVNNRLVDPGAQFALAASQAETRSRAFAEAQATAYAREWERMRQNQVIEALSERICQALSVATGQDLPRSPEAWWAWWDTENEVVLAGSKATQTQYRQELRMYADAQPVNYNPSSTSGSSPSPRRHECFVAGTPVWTVSGPVAIEKLRVGDLVLSQALDTGELAFQPVLQTTQRPDEPLMRIRLATRSEEWLEGSGGHPLWVAGEGWVKLRELKSGMVLHGVGGSAVISDVEPGSTQPTYNLVVSDFHTYVVGEARILCHDNTPRRPTSALVPGLVPR